MIASYEYAHHDKTKTIFHNVRILMLQNAVLSLDVEYNIQSEDCVVFAIKT